MRRHLLSPQGQFPAAGLIRRLAAMFYDSLLCIECKSGEFRRDIDKYLRLAKRLGIPKAQFIICAADLSDEQARGLSAMYDLSFANLQTLPDHLQRLL